LICGVKIDLGVSMYLAIMLLILLKRVKEQTTVPALIFARNCNWSRHALIIGKSTFLKLLGIFYATRFSLFRQTFSQINLS
jgi:hypothetical protein